MDNSLAIRTYIKRLTLIFTVIGALCAVVFYFFAQQHYFSTIPLIFLYFYLINILIFNALIKSYHLNIIRFSNRFMMVTIVKFLLSLIIAVLFMIFVREHIISFLVIFIILYFSSLIQLVHEFQGFINQKKLQ